MIPPVVKEIVVPWPPEAAFRRFTSEVATWWPKRTHSIGQEDTEDVVFTPTVGGTIHEIVKGGAQHVWGTVLAWNPPLSVRYIWHPGEPESTAPTPAGKEKAPKAGGMRGCTAWAGATSSRFIRGAARRWS